MLKKKNGIYDPKSDRGDKEHQLEAVITGHPTTNRGAVHGKGEWSDL